MSRKKEIPYRNKNICGWWVAQYLERFEWHDEDKDNMNRRCTAWENTILIKASDREEAYKKAIIIGKLGDKSEMESTNGKRKGVWRFEGITELLPIYEEIADGSEIIWTEYSNKTVKKIKEMVKAKKELSVFDDSRK